MSRHLRPTKSVAAIVLPACAVAMFMTAGCARRDELPYHLIHTPVHGRPQTVFVDPVGRGYPDIVQRTFPKFEPLPTLRRPFSTRPPVDTSPDAPADGTQQPNGQSALPGAPTPQSAPVLKAARQRSAGLTAPASKASGSSMPAHK